MTKAQREWYLRNKDKVRQSNARLKKAAKALIKKAKDVPCADCGVKYPPYVMDFDHRVPSLKERNIGNLPTRKWSVERIQKEIDKCDVVCANCHRLRTHKDA